MTWRWNYDSTAELCNKDDDVCVCFTPRAATMSRCSIKLMEGVEFLTNFHIWCFHTFIFRLKDYTLPQLITTKLPISCIFLKSQPS